MAAGPSLAAEPVRAVLCRLPVPLLAALIAAGLLPAAQRPARAAEDAPPVAAPPVAAPQVAGFTVTGSIDPPGRLEEVIGLLAPTGSPFVAEGPIDEGEPVSTIGRLRRALERLGYGVDVQARAQESGVVLDIRLRAADRVRQIFVTGNWPLRQEDLTRRLSLRPGQALPPAGPARDARIERERQSVLTYLRDQEGYLEAKVTIELDAPQVVPAAVNLLLRIEHGPGYPIGPILVQGNTALTDAEIAEQFRRLDWRFAWTRPIPFRLSLLREDVAALTKRYRDLGFAGARLTTDYDPLRSVDTRFRNVRLKVNALERKRVEVHFEGNERMSDDDLKDALTIFTRGSYDSFEAEASAESIAQLYRKKGYLFVKVTWRADSSAADTHQLTFTVHEGPSLKVRKVEFIGAHAFSEGRLADVVKVRDFPLLGRFGIGEGGYASIRQLELDTERVSGFYTQMGYPDTQVRCEIAPGREPYRALKDAREQDPDWAKAGSLFVRFTIVEGPRVDIGSVRFEAEGGATLPYGEAFLRESIDGQTGRPYRPDVARSDGDRLRRLLGDAGYSRATVEPAVTRQGNRADLLWQIKLGPPLRVGPLFVRGNFLTTEGTIRRWTLLRPGERLTTTAFERSQRNLALIQIFNNASPISFPPETQVGDVVPMLVEVEERHDHWGIAHAGVGASTDQTLPGDFPIGGYVALGYEHRNLFGQSWILVSHGEIGTTLTRADAEFTDPRLFGTLFRLNVIGTYLRQATVRLGDIRSGSGTIGLSRELYPGVDATLRYGLRDTISTEFLLRGAGPDSAQETVSIGTLVGSFAFSLEWQRLDNQLVPTRGFKLQASVEYAAPSFSFDRGEDTFLKTSARTLAVIPLTPRLSLRHSLRYDQGFPLDGASLLPKVERFFAGGDTTLRGFDLDRARTDDVSVELASGVTAVQYRPIGGSLRILQNIDLQYRVLGPWHVGVFIDNGVVADSFDGLQASDFRHGAGVVPLLFKLPIGDLSVAWGWPLDPRAGDSKTGRLHFNVGLMF